MKSQVSASLFSAARNAASSSASAKSSERSALSCSSRICGDGKCAPREAIQRALANEPKVDDVIARARTAKHPFAGDAEAKHEKQLQGANA